MVITEAEKKVLNVCPNCGYLGGAVIQHCCVCASQICRPDHVYIPIEVGGMMAAPRERRSFVGWIVHLLWKMRLTGLSWWVAGLKMDYESWRNRRRDGRS